MILECGGRSGRHQTGGLTKLVIGGIWNFPELARFYHDEVIQRAHKFVSGAIERGVKSGEFRAVNLPYAQRVACAPMVLLMLWKHSFACCVPNNVDPQEYVATLDGHAHPLAKESAKHFGSAWRIVTLC